MPKGTPTKMHRSPNTKQVEKESILDHNKKKNTQVRPGHERRSNSI